MIFTAFVYRAKLIKIIFRLEKRQRNESKLITFRVNDLSSHAFAFLTSFSEQINRKQMKRKNSFIRHYYSEGNQILSKNMYFNSYTYFFNHYSVKH